MKTAGLALDKFNDAGMMTVFDTDDEIVLGKRHARQHKANAKAYENRPVQ